MLTTGPVSIPSLDRAHISQSAFDWLCRANAGIGLTGAQLLAVADGRALRLSSYVGVLETPCGTRIEILPKTADGPESARNGRRLLARMIGTVIDVRGREAGEASLQTFDAPLSEWVIGSFLRALNRLVKRGIRHDYTRVEVTARYLGGQLNVARQLRRHPGRLHEFDVRHDAFLPDGSENRLLKLALDQVAVVAQSPENWRLAQELRLFLRHVPPSRDVASDFRGWRTERLMAHYAPVRPWCELVLYRRMPLSLVGDWRGISMLFPMEQLFERFVAKWLAGAVEPGVKVRSQAASEFLCHHDGERMFQLRPDVLLEAGNQRWILDTKWKLIDEGDKARKYCLNQGDLYQLFAYGMKYLGEAGGNLVLIYPRSAAFRNALRVFDLGHGLKLHALPFDLEALELLGAGQAGLPMSPIRGVQAESPRLEAGDTMAAHWGSVKSPSMLNSDHDPQ